MRGGETQIDPARGVRRERGSDLRQPGAHIRAFTRINGPCYVGRDASVMGGEITCADRRRLQGAR